jgi:PST family polysaccharide transporter
VADSERYFRTDEVRSDLRHRSVRSGLIAATGNATQIGLQVGSIMVLARVLTPEDFGVIAMVVPIALLSMSIASLGLQAALIHREDLSHTDASLMFWFAAKVNLFGAGAMVALGPLLGLVYRDARVVPVAAIWALSIYVGSLSAIHEALLKRQLHFGAVMWARVCSFVLGTAVAIAAALGGMGYRALLLQIVITDLSRSAMLWSFCRWRPTRPSGQGSQSRTALRLTRSYWAEFSGFRFLTWIGGQLDRVLVGVAGGAAVLGLYDRARKWAWFPFMQPFYALFDVGVATLSRVQQDHERYRSVARQAFLPMLAVPMPVMAFVFVEAQQVVLILFGDQWLDAVPFIRLMSAAAFVGGVGQLTQWLYLSRGNTGRQFRWALVNTPAMVVALTCGSLWGAMGVAWGFTVGTVLLTGPTIAYALRGSAVTWGDLLGVVWRPALAAIGAGTFLAAARAAVPSFGPLLIDIGLSFTLFTALYVTLWLSTPGGRKAATSVIAVVRRPRG